MMMNEREEQMVYNQGYLARDREIVRCEGCKHATWAADAEMYSCSAYDQDLFEAGHFCSYGERRA